MELNLLKVENDQFKTINSDNYNKRELEQFFSDLSDIVEVEVGNIGSTYFYNYNDFDDFINNLNIITEYNLDEKDISVLVDNMYPDVANTVQSVAERIDELVIYPCKNEEELGEYYFEEKIKPELEGNIQPEVYNDIDMYFDYQALGRDFSINNTVVFGNGKAYDLSNL